MGYSVSLFMLGGSLHLYCRDLCAERASPFLLDPTQPPLACPHPRLDPACTLHVPPAGAFVLHHHLTSQAVANLASMSYWTFTGW